MFTGIIQNVDETGLIEFMRETLAEVAVPWTLAKANSFFVQLRYVVFASNKCTLASSAMKFYVFCGRLRGIDALIQKFPDQNLD